ncbi:MAG: serine/threonine-protein kinase [Persicimonas sp.]
MKLENLEGETLTGRFRLTELLGQGGYGAVFAAEQLSVGRRCAVKVLFPHLCEDEASAHRFRTEARTSSRLTHPNSIILYDFGRDEERELLFLAMELLDGCDLASLIAKRGTLDVEQAVHIARQAAGSLHEAHELGLVHRDIKPQNLMLIERGSDPHFVKVIDFGIAKVVSHHLLTASDVTRTGTIVGTPKYMSPEQIRDREIDGRADMYALATTVYKMLTGRTPFEEGTALEIAGRQVAESPRPLRAYRPDLPVGDAFEQVLLRALAKEPDDRFENVAEFADALVESAPSGDSSRPEVTAPMSDAGADAPPDPQESNTKGIRPSAMHGESAPGQERQIEADGAKWPSRSVPIVRPDEYTFEEEAAPADAEEEDEGGDDGFTINPCSDQVTLATLAIPNPARPESADDEEEQAAGDQTGVTGADRSTTLGAVEGSDEGQSSSRTTPVTRQTRRPPRAVWVALFAVAALLVGAGIWYGSGFQSDDASAADDEVGDEDEGEGGGVGERGADEEPAATGQAVAAGRDGGRARTESSAEGADAGRAEAQDADARDAGSDASTGSSRGRADAESKGDDEERDDEESTAEKRTDEESAESEEDDSEPAKPAPPTTHKVEVRVIPWGTLYVDGRKIGDGRRQHVRLTEGRHRLELKQRGEVRDAQTVDVSDGSSKIVELVAQ